MRRSSSLWSAIGVLALACIGPAAARADSFGPFPIIYPSAVSVEVHVGELDVVDVPGSERADRLVELGTDPRHLGLRDSRCDTERSDQVINRAGRYPALRTSRGWSGGDRGEQVPVGLARAEQDA